MAQRKNALNMLVTEICARLVSPEDPRGPLNYGDPLLDRLMDHICYACVPEFAFLAARTPSKRNLWQWWKSRAQGRMLSMEKLFGFTKFAVRLAWRPGLKRVVQRLLDRPEVKQCCDLLEEGEETLAGWKQAVMLAQDPFDRFRKGKYVFSVSAHGVVKWLHTIAVNHDGNGEHTIDATVANLGRNDLRTLLIPIFCDRTMPKDRLNPWASSGEHSLSARAEDWDGNAGSILLAFDEPLRQYEQASYRWGYHTDRLFGPGEEYYRFDINNPTYMRSGQILFSQEWAVANVRVLDGFRKHLGNAVEWTLIFPPPGIYEIRFTLARS